MVPCGRAVQDVYRCTYVSNISTERSGPFAHYHPYPRSNLDAELLGATVCSGNIDGWERDVANTTFIAGNLAERAVTMCSYIRTTGAISRESIVASSQAVATDQCKRKSPYPADTRNVANRTGETLACPCQIPHIFLLFLNLYKFVVKFIALPLAGLFIVLGGLLLAVSGGNPGWAEKGKNMIKYSFIALLLIFGSWLIIDVIMKALGYSLRWFVF